MTPVGRVREHADAVAHREAERAARAALADDERDDRRAQPRHEREVRGDRLGLARLLGGERRPRADRVDQRHDGEPNRSASRKSRCAVR